MIYTTPYIERTLQFHEHVPYYQIEKPTVLFCSAMVWFLYGRTFLISQIYYEMFQSAVPHVFSISTIW